MNLSKNDIVSRPKEQNAPSTRILEKAVDEKLSALSEETLNHGFYGPGKVQNDVRERRKEKEGDERRKKDYATFCL